MKIHLPGWYDPGMPSEVGLRLVEPTPRRDTRCWILDAGTACKVVYPVTRIQYLFAQSPICYAKLDDVHAAFYETVKLDKKNDVGLCRRLVEFYIAAVNDPVYEDIETETEGGEPENIIEDPVPEGRRVRLQLFKFPFLF